MGTSARPHAALPMHDLNNTVKSNLLEPPISTMQKVEGKNQFEGYQQNPTDADEITEEDVDKMQLSLFTAVLTNKVHQLKGILDRFFRRKNIDSVSQKDSRELYRGIQHLEGLMEMSYKLNPSKSDLQFVCYVKMAGDWLARARLLARAIAAKVARAESGPVVTVIVPYNSQAYFEK